MTGSSKTAAWAVLVGCIYLWPSLTLAQTATSPKKKPAAPGGTACGGGITVRVKPATVGQGGLALVDVRSEDVLTKVKGDWGGQAVAFWNQAPPNAPGQPDRWRALLGVDLDKEPGTRELTVFASKKGSDAVGCGAKVIVRPGHYPTERLKVENQFVEPNEEQAARAEKDQEKFQSIYDRMTPEQLWTGKFRLPLDGERTFGNFGRRRVLNGKARSPHSGVDFPAPTGTPVHAAQAGKVVIAQEMFFPGNTVVVDHGLGIYTFYFHLSEIDVKEGDDVAVGALLGKVGATGRVTGPHLHWALSVNHARVNAMQILTIFGPS